MINYFVYIICTQKSRTQRTNPYKYHISPEKSLSKYFRLGFEMKSLPCDHLEYFKEPNVQVMAGIIQHRITEITKDNSFVKGILSPSQEILWSSEVYRSHLSLESELPENLDSEKKVSISVVIKNESEFAWTTDDGIALGNRWFTDDGVLIQGYDGRTPLTKDLLPNSSIEMKLIITAPSYASRAMLKIDMLEEGITWFENHHGQPITRDIEIESKNQCFVVLGMHRSGTSCLAGSIQEAGLSSGNIDLYDD